MELLWSLFYIRLYLLKKIMLVVRGIQNCKFSGPWGPNGWRPLLQTTTFQWFLVSTVSVFRLETELTDSQVGSVHLETTLADTDSYMLARRLLAICFIPKLCFALHTGMVSERSEFSIRLFDVWSWHEDLSTVLPSSAELGLATSHVGRTSHH
jgi:hypothetical protein